MSGEVITFAAGQQAPVRRVGPVTHTDIVCYAGASGDFNPIHHDESFAQGAGYPCVFAHGLLTAGILSAYASHWLGLTSLRKYAVRYVAQVWPGDCLILSGQVDSIEIAADGSQIIQCNFRVEREANGLRQDVLKATAVAHHAPLIGDRHA